jgi:hypothetical protein
LPLRIACLQARDVLWPVAKLRIGLGDHLIGAAEAIEVIDVKRPEVNLQGLEHIRERHALRFGLRPVNVCVKLWHIDLVTREHSSESRCLPRFADQFL